MTVLINDAPLVSLRELRCFFKSDKSWLAAVDGVNLDIYAGEVVGLVGESGSGKSTLGRVIAGLQPRTAGSLIIDGRVAAKRYRRRDFRNMANIVQMVFQDSYASLNPRMTISMSLQEPLLAMGVSVRDAERRAAQWLERVGLASAAAQRYPHELSGGQRQRVGIARAFIAEPQLVICDEAVSALDVSVQAQIIDLLQGLQRELDTAMLFIGHDLAVVRYLADRTAVMYLGEILEIGDTAQVFNAPLHPYTKTLLSAHLDVDQPHLSRLANSKGMQGMNPPLATDNGCRFRPRCPLAEAACAQQPPWLQRSQGGSEVACHRLVDLESR